MTDIDKYFKYFAFISTIIMGLSGCIREINVKTPEDTKKFSFSVEEDLRDFDLRETKGVISDIYCTDENGMSDVTLLAYNLRTGKYQASYHTDNYTGKNECTLELRENTAYRIFAIVNMGDIGIPPDSINGIEKYIYKIDSWKEMTDPHGFLPMAGSVTIDTGAGNDFPIYVKRLVAEINIDYNAPEGLKVVPDSIKVSNSPMEISPFTGNLPERFGDGDRGSEYDMSGFGEGKGIRMFMLENMSYGKETSGTLTVQDPSAPAPENTSWIELYGSIINSAGIKSGNIRYRILLDFDIERNKKYNINFSITPEGIYEDSWRVAVSDAILEMGDEIYMLPNSTMKFGIRADEYTDIKYTSSNNSIVIYSGGYLRSYNPGRTTLTATSEHPSAYGTVSVTVLNNSDDRMIINDEDMLLGEKKTIEFIASHPDRICVATQYGELELDLKTQLVTGIRTVENEAVKLQFDTRKNRMFTVTVKELPYGQEGEYECYLANTSGKKQTFSIKASIPRLNIEFSDRDISECGNAEQYSLYLSHNGKRLEKENFDQELYERYYSSVTNTTESSTLEHIGFSDPSTGYKGEIYGIAAKGHDIYQGTVSFRFTDEIGNSDKGKASATINVIPAFRSSGGRLADIDNMTLLDREMNKHSIPAGSHDIDGAGIEIRHLGWDRIWENGKSPTDKESINTEIVKDGLKLLLGPEASGPYALRLSKTSPITGKTFTSTYYFDIYLNIEVGIHIPWNESGTYSLNIEIIYNINDSGGLVPVLQGERLEFLRVSKRFGVSENSLYCIGEKIPLWGNIDFFYTDPAHASLPPCENFKDSVIDQFNKGNFIYKLHNPYLDRDESGGEFITDENISSMFFGNRNILFRFRLADSFLYTITHNGCQSSTGFQTGEIESNRNM